MKITVTQETFDKLPEFKNIVSTVSDDLLNAEKNSSDLPDKAVSCLYALYDKDKLVYIGQTTDIKARLKVHTIEGKKQFDSYSVLPVPIVLLSGLEAFLVLTHNPEYNAAVPSSDLILKFDDLRKRSNPSNGEFSKFIEELGIRKFEWKPRGGFIIKTYLILSDFADYIEVGAARVAPATTNTIECCAQDLESIIEMRKEETNKTLERIKKWVNIRDKDDCFLGVLRPYYLYFCEGNYLAALILNLVERGLSYGHSTHYDDSGDLYFECTLQSMCKKLYASQDEIRNAITMLIKHNLVSVIKIDENKRGIKLNIGVLSSLYDMWASRFLQDDEPNYDY